MKQEGKSAGPGRQMGFGGRGMGRGMGRGGGEKAKNFKKSIKELLTYLKPYWLHIIMVILFAMASAVFSIVGPKILGNATTEIYLGVVSKIGGGTGINFNAIGQLLIVLLILYVLSALLAYIQNFIMTGISMKISYNMRKHVTEKVNRLPLSYFDNVSQGDILSRMTNDIDTVSQSLQQSMSQIITSGTIVIGVLIMMITISPIMTLVALGMIPVSLFIVIRIVKMSQKYFKKQQAFLGDINGHVEEMYGGHLIIKAFGKEKESLEMFNSLNGELYHTAWKSQFLSGLMMPIMTIISNMGYVAVCILGGALAVKQVIQIGDIQAFIQYVRNFTRPLAQLANVSNVLQQTAAASERVFEFLAEEEEVADTRDGLNKEIVGEVEFKHVHFGYNPDTIIIKDFSVNVRPGQKVAIVGPTGAGKTTMIKLLMRFYDINGGSILIDGKDLRDFTRHDLREQFGMVLQDTWLYNGSIMENIRYGNLQATDEEVIEAAKVAHVDSFVHSLPEGYKMELNEEASNVSQGQKQLITIARAVLANPKILILDEATSSVDTRTEVQIQQAMNRLMEGRTSFIIAHRLSTIRDADMILVMDQGDIVEQGAHEELLKQKGLYAKLYNSQFEAQA